MSLLIVVVVLLGVLPVQAQTIRLKWVEAGAAARMTGVTPHSIDLSSSRPPQVKKIPPGLTNPNYGSFTIGPAERPTHVDILLDTPPGKPSRLFVDVNGNGDFTDDPRPQWEARSYTDSAGHRYLESIGGVTIPVPFGNTTLPMHLNLLRYDPSDPARAGLKGAVLYAPDYAREGQLQLGAKAYQVLLMDALVGGDFRGTPGSAGAGIFLLIDVNGNGVFDTRGEIYSAGQPFNIGGGTYAIRNLTASGDSFELVKSAVKVPEIPPPPDLRIGKVAPAFTQKAMDGAAIRFPADYHGKLVLLSFWASDCGYCSTEMPEVVKAYQMFHAQGLDIIGISLDRANAASDIGKFTKQYGMHWPEIYDGRWMQAEIAQLYFVHLTPTLFLVDGTTGKVLASGADLRGDRLIQTVAVALTGRKK